MTEKKPYPYQPPTVCPCGLPLSTHPKCEGCSMMLDGKVYKPGGFAHFAHPVKYRGRRLCEICVRSWKNAEKREGRELKFAEVFRKGYAVCPACGSDLIRLGHCEECGAALPKPARKKRFRGKKINEKKVQVAKGKL
jgi:hypothetical protein